METAHSVYYIGGGTCCGKSTVAARLRDRHGLQHYNQDDYLEEYLHTMAGAGDTLAARVQAYDNEAMWMRDPLAMCSEEGELYAGMLPHTLAAIQKLAETGPVVAEGAGLLPLLLQAAGVRAAQCVCLVPTDTFRLERYAQREWITYYLSDTSEPDRAFANWMRRDALFSRMAEQQARVAGVPVLVVDGSLPVEGTLAWTEKCLGLGG